MGERPVIARSNGHEWIIYSSLHCCKQCGIVRRKDDRNKPCKGPVKIALREGVQQAKAADGGGR